MKSYAIAAAALLLGTSALAWAPDKGVEGAPLAGESTAAATMAPVDKGALPLAAAGDYVDAAYAKDAAYAEDAFADPAYADLKPMPAAWQEWDDGTAPPPDETMPADETMSVPDTAMPPDQAMPTRTAALDLTPRPATANYPACHPGPGDDNCIQLYERGVRTALASWDQPTGGFVGAESATAMAANTSVNDATNDAMEVASADTDLGTAPAPGATEDMAGADTALAANEADQPPYPSDPNSRYQGVGGPDEPADLIEPTRQTGYPACSATVTDRCIQLYERGVTGEGN
jgi:hypothetical protein